jgi:hypothetical protein
VASALERTQRIERARQQLQHLLSLTPGGGTVCSTAHAFYQCFLGAENFYEYGLALFQPDTEERKAAMRQNASGAFPIFG